MRIWLIAAALALAPASALAQAEDETGPPVVRVEASQNGETVSVVMGAKIFVRLQVNPSTGAHWAVAAKPEFVDAGTMTLAPVTPVAPGARPLLGAPRVAVFEFNITGSGNGELVLEKRGPGAAGAVLETFRITIEAP